MIFSSFDLEHEDLLVDATWTSCCKENFSALRLRSDVPPVALVLIFERDSMRQLRHTHAPFPMTSKLVTIKQTNILSTIRWGFSFHCQPGKAELEFKTASAHFPCLVAARFRVSVFRVPGYRKQSNRENGRN